MISRMASGLSSLAASALTAIQLEGLPATLLSPQTRRSCRGGRAWATGRDMRQGLSGPERPARRSAVRETHGTRAPYGSSVSAGPMRAR